MRATILLAAAIVLLLPSAAASGRQKPNVLTALADIGTVYWRFDCVHYRRPEWSLGIQVFQISATTGLTFRAGKVKLRKLVQPGDPTVWFPFQRERRQSISVVQGTEARNLRATVLARFKRRDCQPYFPPRLSVQLYPR